MNLVRGGGGNMIGKGEGRLVLVILQHLSINNCKDSSKGEKKAKLNNTAFSK